MTVTPVVLGIDPQKGRLGMALVEFEAPHRALWADTISIDEPDGGWQYQQIGAALREVNRQIIAMTKQPEPRRDCENCDGRGCMCCVFREIHDACERDCPTCCGDDRTTTEIVRIGIEDPPYVGNPERFKELQRVCSLIEEEAHRRWPWAPQIPCLVGTWKKAVIGKGNATKDQVMFWSEMALNCPSGSLAQDAADALAIAVYAAGVELEGA